jgi:hypothetical protein
MWLSSTWAANTTGQAQAQHIGVAAPLIGLALRTLDGFMYVWVGYALTLLLRFVLHAA